MQDLSKMDPDVAALIQRIRNGETRPEDSELLERKFYSDTMVPDMRNKAAYEDHLRSYGNSGIHVHTDMNDFGQVNKQHGESVGDDAIRAFGNLAHPIASKYGGRSFHNGGDEFKFWFLHPEHAERFARDLHQAMDEHSAKQRFGGTHRMAASIGIGFNRDHAEAALQHAKSQLGPKDVHGHRQNKHAVGDAPSVIYSAVGDAQPAGWKPAEAAIGDMKGTPVGAPPKMGTKLTQQKWVAPHDGTATSTTMPSSFTHTYVSTEPSNSAPHGFIYKNPLGKSEPRHPALGGEHVGIMSAENPMHGQNTPGPAALEQELRSKGLRFERVQGKYDKPENGYVIYQPSVEDMHSLGRRYGQESVVFSKAGKHALIYTNGPMAGTFHPGAGVNVFNRDTPENHFTTAMSHETGEPLNFSYKIDWNQTLPLRLLAEKISHPHGYEWHNGHTRHEQSVKAEAPPKMSKDEKNDQAAGPGVSTFTAMTHPFGTTTPGVKSNLLHYDYRPFEGKVDEAIKKHGFQVVYAGGKHGKSDLANKNYNTGHLMIYDPTPASGGDFGEEAYTRSWRKVHELAHAMTYPALNAKYGEGRRMGKLGVHRSPAEAKRAVEWEWLAAHKQRELGAQMGHHIPDELFHKELNTVMADAVHRAITGKFTEPSDEGFVPHAHKVPLETALGVIDHQAKVMGLADDNATIQKNPQLPQSNDHVHALQTGIKNLRALNHAS